MWTCERKRCRAQRSGYPTTWHRTVRLRALLQKNKTPGIDRCETWRGPPGRGLDGTSQELLRETVPQFRRKGDRPDFLDRSGRLRQWSLAALHALRKNLNEWPRAFGLLSGFGFLCGARPGSLLRDRGGPSIMVTKLWGLGRTVHHNILSKVRLGLLGLLAFSESDSPSPRMALMEKHRGPDRTSDHDGAMAQFPLHPRTTKRFSYGREFPILEAR